MANTTPQPNDKAVIAIALESADGTFATAPNETWSAPSETSADNVLDFYRDTLDIDGLAGNGGYTYDANDVHNGNPDPNPGVSYDLLDYMVVKFRTPLGYCGDTGFADASVFVTGLLWGAAGCSVDQTAAVGTKCTVIPFREDGTVANKHYSVSMKIWDAGLLYQLRNVRCIPTVHFMPRGPSFVEWECRGIQNSARTEADPAAAWQAAVFRSPGFPDAHTTVINAVTWTGMQAEIVMNMGMEFEDGTTVGATASSLGPPRLLTHKVSMEFKPDLTPVTLATWVAWFKNAAVGNFATSWAFGNVAVNARNGTMSLLHCGVIPGKMHESEGKRRTQAFTVHATPDPAATDPIWQMEILAVP